MGEATYYLKATYGSTEDAKKAMKKIKQFFLQGAKAYDFWQTNRGAENGPPKGPFDKRSKDSPIVTREDFWALFKQKFPLICEMIPDLVGKDCNNSPAGQMSFGSEEDIKSLQVNDAEHSVRYHAVVWHCASWDRIAQWIQANTKAITVKWISDEDVNIEELL